MSIAHTLDKCHRKPKGQSRMENPDKLATPSNQEWTLQRHWQHRAHKTKTNKTNNTT